MDWSIKEIGLDGGNTSGMLFSLCIGGAAWTRSGLAAVCRDHALLVVYDFFAMYVYI